MVRENKIIKTERQESSPTLVRGSLMGLKSVNVLVVDLMQNVKLLYSPSLCLASDLCPSIVIVECNYLNVFLILAQFKICRC